MCVWGGGGRGVTIILYHQKLQGWVVGVEMEEGRGFTVHQKLQCHTTRLILLEGG